MCIRMVFMDLDGTLLTSQKTISPHTRHVLQMAADRGIEIVPATGRFCRGIPPVVRELPFIRYVVAMNGAEILDLQEKRVLFRSGLAYEDVERLMAYMDTLPVIYDCFQDGWGWMDAVFYRKIRQYIQDPHTAEMVETLRTPVQDLRASICEKSGPVCKMQMFFADRTRRIQELERAPRLFPTLSVSTSIVNNIEFTSPQTHKGAALKTLCAHLKIAQEETAAFGDDFNDISMLQSAGTGVAMANASESVKLAADRITGANDEDGVASVLEEYL